jgi:hypothetical protein
MGAIRAALLGCVTEDEPTTALATGVHHRTLSGRRELLEHFCAQTFDILDCEAPEAASRKVDCSQEAAGFPVADRVLMHA